MDNDVPAPIFFRPADGWVGDVIPFSDGDKVNLFYLHDRRDSSHPGTSWNLYTTRDFSTYEYHGVSLQHGSTADQDLNAYTGSIIHVDGVTHLFYTGQNPEFLIDGTTVPAQVVMHATSVDGMTTWEKHPEHTFGAPAGYEAADWRDPFVFRPEAAGPWHMLLAARVDTGPSRRRGVIAGLVSDDLVTWTIAEPFWAPNRYIAHECPEVFQLGDWWYLVYSEFSDHFVTRYRMSRSPFGPWTVPLRDSIDGRAFYAGKSAELNGARYFAGWIPTREGNRDSGAWQWAGDFAAHEAVQADDGTLDIRMPKALRASFRAAAMPQFQPVLGDWTAKENSWTLVVPDAYGVAVSQDAPDQFLLDVILEVGENTTECGVILRASADGDEGYIIRLEPRAGRLVFDRWPRETTGEGQWQVSGDISHEIELERPIEIGPGLHRLSVVVDGSVCVAYLDDKIAMSARMYDRRGGGVGLFVGEGSTTFTAVSIAVRQ
jgi:beta-fructofuranosidase